MTSNEWVARKWRSIRTSSAFLGLAGIALGGFLLLHAWSFGDRQGATGSCAAVLSLSHTDTIWKLDVPPETALAFCDQQRSAHTREAVGALVFTVVAGGFSVWAHRQTRKALSDSAEAG